jgi:hypothetical protein
MTNRNAVAQHGLALAQIGQRHLVRLRHLVAQHQATGQLGAGRQAAVVADDGDVVALVHPDQHRLHATAPRVLT